MAIHSREHVWGFVLACLLCVCAGAVPQRGTHFAETSTRARQTIAELGSRFVRNNTVLLTHGYSRVVLDVLQRAVAQVRRGAGPVPSTHACVLVHCGGR